MRAKIQKTYRLVIGTNDDKATIADINKAAYDLEGMGNKTLPVRVHIEEVIK